MSTSHPPEIELYTYWASSCAARVRLALSFKQLPYTPITLDTSTQPPDEKYTLLNPSKSVPTLIIEPSTTTKDDTIVITQSYAALEYLCETFPSHGIPLMPPISQPLLRSRVRELCMIIVADTQPVTNTRILKKLASLSPSPSSEPWLHEFYSRGLAGYDTTASKYAGIYSVGDEITMADICLVPAVWNAERIGLGVEEWPTVKGVYERLMEREEVGREHWREQRDCPGELKEKR